VSADRPPKPTPLTPILENIPLEFKSLTQWVLWAYEHRDGKWTKVPSYRRPKAEGGYVNGKAKANDSNTWMTYQDTIGYFEKNAGHWAGVGLELHPDDPYSGIDLDHCRNPETGELSELAQTIASALDSYTEVSPSGTGLRIFVKGNLPPGGRKHPEHGVEMYDSGRYLTMTGHKLEGYPDAPQDRQDALEKLHGDLFPPKPKSVSQATSARGPSEVSDLSDAALLEKAGKAKNGPKFSSLWAGDWQGAGFSSQSEADLSLAGSLWFWTGGDAARADRLFRQSGLYRDKWDTPHFSDGRTYGQATLERCEEGEVYNPKNKNSAYSPFSPLPLTAINPRAGTTAVNGSGKKELEPSADWFIDPALIPALEWGEILPLPALERELPLLEPELIPVPLRPWICDLSELSGLPPEAFLAPAVSAVGCLIGRRVAVRPKRFDTSWKVTANMWGMLIGRPSSKKSFAVSEATKPLAVLERRAREEFEASQVERDLEREMLEAQIKAKKKALEDALTGSAPRKGQPAPTGSADSFKTQVLELHAKMAVLEQDAHPRRYLVNSSTVEKLGELLRENPNGLMVLRDEIKGFFGEMDKAGREGEKQFHLEAWNGIGSFTFDRIGRGTVYIPNMCVGVFGGIQPSVIQKYITGALEEGEGSDGFLQRFRTYCGISSKGACFFAGVSAFL